MNLDSDHIKVNPFDQGIAVAVSVASLCCVMFVNHHRLMTEENSFYSHRIAWHTRVLWHCILVIFSNVDRFIDGSSSEHLASLQLAELIDATHTYAAAPICSQIFIMVYRKDGANFAWAPSSRNLPVIEA